MAPFLNVDKTASKWLLRSEETAKNKNKNKNTKSRVTFMSIFVKKMELKTYFVYFHKFSYKFKSHLVWVTCEFTYQLQEDSAVLSTIPSRDFWRVNSHEEEAFFTTMFVFL